MGQYVTAVLQWFKFANLHLQRRSTRIGFIDINHSTALRNVGTKKTLVLHCSVMLSQTLQHPVLRKVYVHGILTTNCSPVCYNAVIQRHRVDCTTPRHHFANSALKRVSSTNAIQYAHTRATLLMLVLSPSKFGLWNSLLPHWPPVHPPHPNIPAGPRQQHTEEPSR